MKIVDSSCYLSKFIFAFMWAMPMVWATALPDEQQYMSLNEIKQTDDVAKAILHDTSKKPFTHFLSYLKNGSDKMLDKSVPIPDLPKVDVPTYLSLSQAHDYLPKVSAKIFADEADIASHQAKNQAFQGLNRPMLLLHGSLTAYHLQTDMDLMASKNQLANGINQNLPINLPIINAGNALSGLLPDSYPLNRKSQHANANLSVVWSAYNGGKTQAIQRLFANQTEESKADAQLNANELHTTLTKRYFAAQLALMASYLRDDALKAIQQTDYMAQRYLDEGFISQIDRLEAKSALADAEYQAQKAKDDAKLALTALQTLFRTPYLIKPTTGLFVNRQPLADLSYFQQLAKDNHPAFAKVAAKYQQAKALHHFNQATDKPNINLFGTHQISDKPSWIAGVSASWKLWGGIDRQQNSQAGLQKIQQAEFTHLDVSDNILLLVQKNWQAVGNAQTAYLALNKNIELAENIVKFRELGLKEGVNTAVELMQAQAKLRQAKTEQAKAAFDYIVALADLMQSCGTPLNLQQYVKTADIHLPAPFIEHQAD